MYNLMYKRCPERKRHAAATAEPKAEPRAVQKAEPKAVPRASACLRAPNESSRRPPYALSRP